MESACLNTVLKPILAREWLPLKLEIGRFWCVSLSEERILTLIFQSLDEDMWEGGRIAAFRLTLYTRER
jgi:hypothetical protein